MRRLPALAALCALCGCPPVDNTTLVEAKDARLLAVTALWVDVENEQSPLNIDIRPVSSASISCARLANDATLTLNGEALTILERGTGDSSGSCSGIQVSRTQVFTPATRALFLELKDSTGSAVFEFQSIQGPRTITLVAPQSASLRAGDTVQIDWPRADDSVQRAALIVGNDLSEDAFDILSSDGTRWRFRADRVPSTAAGFIAVRATLGARTIRCTFGACGSTPAQSERRSARVNVTFVQ